MPPKSESYRKRQKAKQAKRVKAEAELIRKEHENFGAPGEQRDREAASVQSLLSAHGLHMVDVAADGNCLFSALALLRRDSTNGERMTPMAVRRAVAQHMLAHPDDFAPFVEGDLTPYCESLQSSPSHLGSILEVRAAADVFGAAHSCVEG